jgi:SAM-dependent methyltransferase
VISPAHWLPLTGDRGLHSAVYLQRSRECEIGRVGLVQQFRCPAGWAPICADHSFDATYATKSVQLWQPLAGSLAEVRRVVRPGGRLVLGMHERAVLPGGGTAGRWFDDVLLVALPAAGFPAAG